jgi:hypothetical protein
MRKVAGQVKSSRVWRLKKDLEATLLGLTEEDASALLIKARTKRKRDRGMDLIKAFRK